MTVRQLCPHCHGKKEIVLFRTISKCTNCLDGYIDLEIPDPPKEETKEERDPVNEMIRNIPPGLGSD